MVTGLMTFMLSLLYITSPVTQQFEEADTTEHTRSTVNHLLTVFFSVRKAFPAVRGRPSVAWGFRPPSVRSVNLSALEGSQPLGSVYLSKE